MTVVAGDAVSQVAIGDCGFWVGGFGLLLGAADVSEPFGDICMCCSSSRLLPPAIPAPLRLHRCRLQTEQMLMLPRDVKYCGCRW